MCIRDRVHPFDIVLNIELVQKASDIQLISSFSVSAINFYRAAVRQNGRRKGDYVIILTHYDVNENALVLIFSWELVKLKLQDNEFIG